MRYFVLIIATCMPTWAFSSDYICISEKASGFKYSEGTWSHTKIRTDAKYLVSFEKGTVSRFGENFTLHSDCLQTNFFGTHLFQCLGGFGEFTMSADTLKYILTAPWLDYVLGKNKGTPHIELGTCSKL